MSYYKYYDTPDGHDFFKKQRHLLRYSMAVSCTYMPIDVFMITKPIGVVPVMDRVLRTFSRPIIFASLFGTGTYFATKIRGKDDGWNHAFGVFCAFRYWAHLYPRPKIVWCLFGVSALTACCFKNAKMEENISYAVDLYHVREYLDTNLLYHYLDSSIYEEKPKGWITKEEAEKRGLV